MKKEVVVIVDLGHEDCGLIKDDVESLGAKAAVCEHDITEEGLEELVAEFGEIKGFILNGGPHKNVNGFRPEASEAIYEMNLPMYSVDHASYTGIDMFSWPADEAVRRQKIREFLADNCGMEIRF